MNLTQPKRLGFVFSEPELPFLLTLSEFVQAKIPSNNMKIKYLAGTDAAHSSS
jgi:hypothetical protein